MSSTQPPAASDAAARPGIVTPARALIVVAVYAVIFMTIQLISGVDYDELAESSSNLIWFVVAPVGLGVFAIGALTVKWGALPELLHEPERLRKPAFLALLPVVIALYVLIALATSPWDEWSASLIALIVIGTILVGIGEELVFRGYVLVGARQRFSEVGAWFVSSALFGLFHGLNILTGQGVGTTIQQIVMAFLIGSAFYLVRRWSGTLLLPIALHALWDCSTFLHGGRGNDAAAGVATSELLVMLPVWIAMALTVAGLVKVLRHRPAAQPASQPSGPPGKRRLP